MIAFLLLRGKEFSLPDDVSAAIIGLFFGLICGLFYYQHYQKPYFWAFSLAGGLVFTLLSHAIFLKEFTVDDASGIQLTIASFAIPFALTLALNHGLYYLKRNKRKRRPRRRETDSFFEMPASSDALRANETGEDVA
jgi:O-antigen/teichoic acid export membrane protein